VNLSFRIYVFFLLVESSCWFDDVRSRFFASFRTNISMLEIKPEIKDRIMTHDRPIVAGRYIARQKQVFLCVFFFNMN
jgi:hypothetical protein